MSNQLSPRETLTLRQMVIHQDRNGFDGMGAIGSASYQRMRRLEFRGLVHFVEYGALEDCNMELMRCRNGCREDHPIYAITDAGRKALDGDK